MTEKYAELIHETISDRISTYKNWIASAVEDQDFDRAQKLTKTLREYQAIYAAFNMQAKNDYARSYVKPIRTNHVVREINS